MSGLAGMAAKLLNRLGVLGVGVAITGGVVNTALYTVDGGQRAVIFDRFRGVQDLVVGEGTHFMIPWVQRPILFDIRSRPRSVPTVTGSKDLQNVNITLRILFRPQPLMLPNIFKTLGVDYDERVLPSVVNEVLKAVVARFDAAELITQRDFVSQMMQEELTSRAESFGFILDDISIAEFNAGELITQREMVSERIREQMVARAASFGFILDDISITHLTFGRDFTEAVELKQVAQQDAERARYIVEMEEQKKIAAIIRAEGDSQGAALLAKAFGTAGEGLVELRKIEAAEDIAYQLSQSPNVVYLPEGQQTLLSLPQ